MTHGAIAAFVELVCHPGKMSERHVSTGAAARAVGVSLTSLHRWAHAGKVRPAMITPGGHFRWDLDDLRKQLRTNPPTATGEPMPEPSSAPVKQPVVAAIVISDRGLLIVKRRDGKPPYAFLSGEIEPGESPSDAAVRECKEEAELAIRAGETIAERIHPKTGRLMIYMAAEPTRGTDVFVGDEEELEDVRWVSLAEADDLMASYGGMYAPVHEYLERILSQA